MRFTNTLARWSLAGVVAGLLAFSSAASAQPRDVRLANAAALYDRGMVLFEAGDVANAKKMFSESLEQDSEGSQAADALRMLRECNEKLGVADLDAGRPTADPTDTPVDPYAGTDPKGDVPVDPYGGPGDGNTGNGTIGDGNTGDGSVPVDPYGDGGEGKSTEPPPESAYGERLALMTAGGALGFALGMSIAGPAQDEDGDGELDEVSGGAVLLGLALGGGGVYLGHYSSKSFFKNRVQARQASSTVLWGMYNFAHLANVFSGETTDVNDVYLGLALGGAAGAGLGSWMARKHELDEGDLAFANSLGLYGTTAGLLLGVAIDPPRGDAYSLNAALGSMAGLGAGLYFQDKIDVSRRRMFKVDLGAAAGAAVPWLIYPLVANDDGGGVRVTGFLSMVGMGAGAYGAWYLTRNHDKKKSDKAGEEEPSQQAPVALLRRSAAGTWSFGAPMVGPMNNPILSPPVGLSVGTSVLSGRF